MPELRSYRTTARLAALIAASVFFAACSSDTAPSASQQVDVGAALNAMSVPGASTAMSSASSSASSADVDAPAIVPSACSYSATSQSFTCPAVTVNGLTIDRSYTLLDAQGNAQSAADKSTTDGVATLVTVSGTVAMGGGSMTVNGTRHMKLTGLLSGNRVLNGDDNTAVTGTTMMSGTSSQFTMNLSTVTKDIALPPAGSTSKYPLSGSFTMNMSMSSGTLASTSTQMVLTFNGTSTATVTIKTSTGTSAATVQNCTLDLTGKSGMSCTP